MSSMIHLVEDTTSTINIMDFIQNNSECTEQMKKTVKDLANSLDSFEITSNSLSELCNCYENYSVSKGMPKSIFADSFGYQMQEDISQYMFEYYSGTITQDELEGIFEKCCKDMRIYRTRQRETNGNNDMDNKQIVSEMYEVFIKENARAATRINYAEGEEYSKSLGKHYRNDDWVYYNAKYYYQCSETKSMLAEIADHMTEKWEIHQIDTEEIERNSRYTADGKSDFNSMWNFTFRNQVGRASLSDESMAPPKDFKLFFKESMYSTKSGTEGIVEMWLGGEKYSKKIALYTAGLQEEVLYVDALMKDGYQKKNYSKTDINFLRNIAVFSRWYSYASGINNIFGNYTP